MVREFRNASREHLFRLRTVHATMALPEWLDAVVLRSRETVFIYTNSLHSPEKQMAVAESERRFVTAHPDGPGARFAVLEAAEPESTEKQGRSRVGAILVQPGQYDDVQDDTQ